MVRAILFILLAVMLSGYTTTTIIQPQTEETVVDGLIGYYAVSNTTIRDATDDDGIHQQFTTTTAGTVSRIGVVLGNTTTGNHFECAIYSSDKSTRLAYATSTSIQSDYGWNYANLVSSYVLEAATSYWLIAALVDDNDWKARGNNAGSNSVYYDGTWSSSDATINESILEDSSADFAIFADNGQVTP